MNPAWLAILLALLFVVLAAPVSAALGRAAWPSRYPRAVLVLWQAICLAAGVSLVGAGLVIALAPSGDNIFAALARLWRHAWAGHPFAGLAAHRVAALTLALAVAVVLLGALVRSVFQATRRRRAHRHLLDLLTGQRPDRPPLVSADVAELLVDVRILDHADAIAYTLPGWHSRVVLSAGLVGLLSRAELGAVVDHERAHVRSRHDLLALPFQAWATVLGWLPGVRAAQASVAELIEMLADDLAARRSGRPVLASALARVTLAGAERPSWATEARPADTPTAVARRVIRLRIEMGEDGRGRAGWIYLLAVGVLALPAMLMIFGWR